MSILIDDREPPSMVNNIRYYNQSLQLLASITVERLEIGDYLYIPNDESIGKLLMERKGIESDFLSSIFSGLSNDQIKRMLEESRSNPKLRICYGINGSDSLLNDQTKKILSTFCAQLIGLNIPILRQSSDSMLAHEFIRLCQSFSGMIRPRFNVLESQVNNRDTVLLRQLKQFPGISDTISSKLSGFKNHLQMLGINIKLTDKEVKEIAMKLSNIVRQDKKLKHAPKKPLEVLEKLILWEIGLWDENL